MAANSTTLPVPAYSAAAGTADRLVVNFYRYDGSAATSADWLTPVAFCLGANQKLIETTPADTTCLSTSAPVIADGVSAFSVQSFNAGAGAGLVIEIQLTVTGATGQSVSLTSHTGPGGTL